MKKIVKNPYFITGIVAFFILFVIFFLKGIFPFGGNTLIYGDMHDQITAFYYHFYDVFHGQASLMIDFSTSGGVNFFGIMAYYILSPFTLLLLLFPRDQIYLAVSLVIALKIFTASLTCLYSIRTLFKDKCPFMLSIILALSYAFSGYSFILYQITPWMDAMYLFPLVVVGLKKLFDGEKPYLYIGSLTLSIIFSFYVSYMSLILIFLLSFVYIFVYKKKEEWKKNILALGLSTVFAIGLSMFITLPSLLQIAASSRLGFSISGVLNSKLGPITDKVSYFLSSSFLLVGVALLFLDYKKHKEFLKWYFPTLLILGIPYFIEPVNKMIHFFSYAFFPNRYGYMMIYCLVIGVAYYFTHSQKKKEIRHGNLIARTMTLLCSIAVASITVLYYERFQDAFFHLTISKDKYLIFLLLFMCITVMIGVCSSIFAKRVQKCYPYIFILVVTQALCNGYLYLGLSDYQEEIQEPYQAMEAIENFYSQQKNHFLRLKTNTSSLITNNGMVTKYHNLDHFTSLVDGNNLRTLKQLGYSSHWTKTYSKNGTLFGDYLLANQYYLTTEGIEDERYQLLASFSDYQMYELKHPVSYGYFTKNIHFDEKEHVFDFQNRIYQAITGSNQKLFEVYDDFDATNLKISKKDGRTKYQIDDEDAVNYLEMDIPVSGKKTLYLEVFNSFANTDDDAIYNHMKIYVNRKLFKEQYPLTNNNGSLKLGVFEDEKVHVQIEFLYDTDLSYIEVGAMNDQLLNEFVQKENVSSEVSFVRNKVQVKVDSEESGLFFIPVTYSDGYNVYVDGKKVELVSVYDNYLGVELASGNHTVEFVYTTPHLKAGILISALTLLLMICLFHFGWYDKILQNKLVGVVVENIYLFLYFFLLFFIYLVPIVCFFLSYIFYIC